MTDEVKYRDAVTGEYVTEDYAKANPETTVAETDEGEPWEPAPPLTEP